MSKEINKQTDNKSKKPSFFKKVWAKIKEVFSELKKVSWPAGNKVVKQILVVLSVVLIFIVVITLMDLGLSALLNLIKSI